MYAIAPTDPRWFDFLKENYVTGYVNFWTPTPWGLKSLEIGSRWYFKKKGGEKLICGYGTYCGIDTMTVKEAWKVFGPSNGCDSYASFKGSLGDYNAAIADDKEIGTIYLSDVVFFDEQNFIDLDAIGVDWSNSIVKFKRYIGEDKICDKNANIDIEPFKLVDKIQKRKKKIESSVREGQSEFRQKIASAYSYKCCITGEDCPDLLEAAHIQPYVSKESNHVQNGLLLRVDFHKMFDSGLLAVDEKYHVIISPQVKSEYYKSFNGKELRLPKSESDYPSIEALNLKVSELR